MSALIPVRPDGQAIFSLAAAFVAGLAAHLGGLPLAWVIGPLAASAIWAIIGFSVYAPVAGRRAGQLVIGTAIGLKITLAIIATAMWWLPVMLLAAFLAVVLAAIASIPMAAAARTDRKTAFFAMVPGGLSEMANIGASVGAASEPIALAQALRVALVVLLMPPLVFAFGIDGGIAAGNAALPLSLVQTLILLAVAPGGVAVVSRLGISNSWMLGAILAGAVLSISGLAEGSMPRLIFYAGQFALGVAIGARFTRESVKRLPRVIIFASLLIMLMAGALLGFSYAVAALTGFELGTLALATAPGGMAEMAVTAQALHLNVALITTFHVVRAIVINGFSLHYWALYQRLIGEGARPG